MKLIKAIIEYWKRDTFEFEYDPEYDRLHSMHNENHSILTEGMGNGN